MGGARIQFASLPALRDCMELKAGGCGCRDQLVGNDSPSSVLRFDCVRYPTTEGSALSPWVREA